MAKFPIPENCSAYVPMIFLNLKFPEIDVYTSETACQHNSFETTEQNFMKLGR
jgi:hypothetical protein